MSAVTVFLIGLVITLASALVVVRYIWHSLKAILVNLCGTVERAEFWLAFSNLTLTLVPVIFALSYRPENESLIFAIGSQLERAFIGLACSVIGLGLVLSRFIPAYTEFASTDVRNAGEIKSVIG